MLSYICLHPPRGNNLATGRPRLLDTFSSLGLCGCVTRETNLPDWRRVRVSVRLRRPSRLLARLRCGGGPRGAGRGPRACSFPLKMYLYERVYIYYENLSPSQRVARYRRASCALEHVSLSHPSRQICGETPRVLCITCNKECSARRARPPPAGRVALTRPRRGPLLDQCPR